jgi:hypothetical protein
VSNPAAGGGRAGWRGSCRPRPPHAPSGHRNGFGARAALPSRVISNAAFGDGEGAVAARRRPANPDRRRVRVSHPDHRARHHRHGSREGPVRSAAGIGVQIHREATRRRPRPPIRNPIPIGAGGAGGVVEGAVLGLAVRVRAGVPPVIRGPADA